MFGDLDCSSTGCSNIPYSFFFFATIPRKQYDFGFIINIKLKSLNDISYMQRKIKDLSIMNILAKNIGNIPRKIR